MAMDGVSKEEGDGGGLEGLSKEKDESFDRPPRAKLSPLQRTRTRMRTAHLEKEVDRAEEASDVPSRPASMRGLTSAVTAVNQAARLQRRRPPAFRKGSMSLMDRAEESKSEADEVKAKSPRRESKPRDTFRRQARRSISTLGAILPDEQELEETQEVGGGIGRLKLLTSAVASFQSSKSFNEAKVGEVVVGDPNEVILPADDDSDDEENEEVERDFVSALQRIRDSGRLSIHEFRVFEKELRMQTLFQDELDMVILAGLDTSKYLEVKSEEILWSRFSELYSGILSVETPLCIIVSGRVSVAKPGLPEGDAVSKGSIISAADPEVLGLVTLEPCKLLYKDLTQVQEDMERAREVHKRVDHALRRRRPPSTWSEDLIDDLLLSIKFLPFFEDFDAKTLRSLARNLRFRSFTQGESLPPTLPTDVSLASQECQLVLFWLGKAGKYKRVQSTKEELLSAQLEEMMALTEFGGRKGNKSVIASPNGKDGKEADMPELDDEICEKDDKVYLKRIGNLHLGAVLGQRNLVDPGGPDTGEPLIRCEGPCEVLCLSRSDFLHCLKEPQVERMRVVHALRNVPASRPGEPHHRSQEQLALLAKLVRNTPELKAFEQEELMQVLGAATYINAVPGHVLCHQGEIGDRFFAIIEGMVSIHVRPKVEVESTLASAAEKKGGGAGLIKAMLAALSHQKAEAKKEQSLLPPEIPRTSSSMRSEASDVSLGDSMSLSPMMSPTSSLKPERRPSGAARRKAVRVSFFGGDSQELAPQTPDNKPEIMSDESDIQEADESRESIGERETLSVPLRTTDDTRRKSFRERLQGGLFWTGIRKRLAATQADEPASLGKMVNRMGPGAAFGARTLLKKEARTASVQTVEPTKLLVVTREDYVGLLGSMGEARAREAAEFLCRYVLMVETRGGRASDNLHPALRQRMSRTSKSMTSHSLDRGTVLLTHGTETSSTIHILRKGVLAYCYPSQQGRPLPKNWHRSKIGSMNPSQVVSTPGEVVGAYNALLGWKEPATVRVESAHCEVYRLPWTELQRVLTNRVVTLMRDKLQQGHGLRSQVAANQSPKDMLNATANLKLEGAVPSKEQQAVKDALENALDTACSFGGSASHRKRHAEKGTRSERVDDAAAESEFEDAVAAAILKLEDATKKADLWESLRTGEAEVSIASSLPPPITSAAHVRARFFKVLKEDPGLLRMEHFMAQAALDPDKAHLSAWIKKYATSDHLRKHSDLQTLQLLLRRQLKNPQLAARLPL